MARMIVGDRFAPVALTDGAGAGWAATAGGVWTAPGFV
jgi:hypothetical protein